MPSRSPTRVWSRVRSVTLNVSVWENTGQTIVVTTNTGPLNLSGGTIQGGSITTSNGTSVIVSGSATLDGVTINGTLDVGNTYNGANLTVTNGLVLNGTALVGNPTNGTYGVISFAGTQTFGGNGTVVFGNAGGCWPDALRLASGGADDWQRDHGAGTGPPDGYTPNCWGGPQNVAVINQGTISANVSGGTIVVNAQPFTSTGLVESPRSIAVGGHAEHRRTG